jgi:hypothetical protein
MNPFRLVFAGSLALALVGCSSTASQAPGTTATPTTPAEQSAGATATPTEAASGTLVLPSFDLPHNAAELEALLPDKIGNETLTKSSSTGADFLKSTLADPAIVAWLQSLGKSPADVSVATAIGIQSSVLIFAFRVAGVDHTTLITALKKAVDDGMDTPLTWTPASVGGKNVETAVEPSQEGTVYLYGTADLVFEISAKDPAVAGEVLSKLP